MPLIEKPTDEFESESKSEAHPQERVAVRECTFIFPLLTELPRRFVVACAVPFEARRTTCTANTEASDSSATKE